MPISITIQPNEYYDEIKNKFTYYPPAPVTIVLEHSLLSISKWEAKWHKPFLNISGDLTDEQMLDYMYFMCIKPSPDTIDKNWLLNIDNESAKKIRDYIDNPMTATFFSDNPKGKAKTKINNRIVTNELIYYWMTAYQIPFSCEKWHINKLLTLIRVCNAETEAANNPEGKKMSKSEIYARNKALNAQRRAKLHSKG